MSIKETDQFYINQPEPNRGCFLALREVILTQDPHVTETVKYGMPCFTYKGKMFCYLWQDKKTQQPYILMVEGKHLQHSLLEQGDRARMKILSIDPISDLPLATIEEILKQALDLYRTGTIRTKG